LVDAQPYQNKKRGADTGIDGLIYFQDEIDSIVESHIEKSLSEERERVAQKAIDDEFERALNGGDDYLPPLYDDDEYVGTDLEEKDTIKITSGDLLHAMDMALSHPSTQRTLAFCKKILDDAKEILK